jgi:RNA polymerase sigma factor (sigma-70 family)
MVLVGAGPVYQMSRVELRVEDELISRCLDGDQTAWRELVQKYQRLLYSIARTICPQPDDASDVFQQVWMELYQQLSRLRNIEALPAWLITVTKRKAYSVARSKHASEVLDEELSDPSQSLTAIENEHAVELALDQMPERCRRLIDLLYFRMDEPSYAEIAKAMDMPVPSIGPTRARCLEKLRKFLR